MEIVLIYVTPDGPEHVETCIIYVKCVYNKGFTHIVHDVNV